MNGRHHVFAFSVCFCVGVFLCLWRCVRNASMRPGDATCFLENRMSNDFDIWWGRGSIPSADLRRVAAQMLIKYLIRIIYSFLMRHVFLRTIGLYPMLMLLGEGKGPYRSQTGKEFQPNMCHNFLTLLGVLLVFNVVLFNSPLSSPNYLAQESARNFIMVSKQHWPAGFISEWCHFVTLERFEIFKMAAHMVSILLN